jgi:hypothetical protein
MEHPDPLDLAYLEALCSILEGHKATFFQYGALKIGFGSPESEDEEDEERVSTDVRGFQAESKDDDDDDDPEERLRRQHSRAFGAPMPLLNPAPPKTKKD